MNRVNLAGCAIVKENKILLLHRIKTDWLELPGGKIDDGETPETAATRELQEELCCDIEIVKKLGSKDFEENGYTMGYNWYLAKIKPGQLPRIGEPEKFSEFKYISLSELNTYKLSTNMKNFAGELQNGTIALNS